MFKEENFNFLRYIDCDLQMLGHQCVCVALVESNGIHGLSFKKNSARIPRHSSMNDVVQKVSSEFLFQLLKNPCG